MEHSQFESGDGMKRGANILITLLQMIVDGPPACGLGGGCPTTPYHKKPVCKEMLHRVLI
jgi:hypothetical protein